MYMKDAYLLVPIFPPHQRFLWVSVEDHPFFVLALLFSLSTTSRVFTKVLGILCTQGIPVSRILDNLLLGEQFTSVLETNVSQTVHTLKRFRWDLNLQKSPQQNPEVTIF